MTLNEHNIFRNIFIDVVEIEEPLGAKRGVALTYWAIQKGLVFRGRIRLNHIGVVVSAVDIGALRVEMALKRADKKLKLRL